MFLSLEIVSMKWYNYVYWARHLYFIVCERQEMSRFRQWAWVMVSKRRWAPVNVRTSCMSANERSKARLNVVQPRQSVWLSYHCRHWTATWSVLVVLLSQMSAIDTVDGVVIFARAEEVGRNGINEIIGVYSVKTLQMTLNLWKKTHQITPEVFKQKAVTI